MSLWKSWQSRQPGYIDFSKPSLLAGYPDGQSWNNLPGMYTPMGLKDLNGNPIQSTLPTAQNQPNFKRPSWMLTQSQMDEMQRKYGQPPPPPQKNKMTGYEAAGLIVGGMGVVNNLLDQREYRDQAEEAKKYGYTDSAYGSYTPSFSRGYQETNRKNPATNYSFAQFAGQTLAPSYGYAQLGGVLMPSEPTGAYEMDVFNQLPQPDMSSYNVESNNVVTEEEPPKKINPKAGQISFTHNNPLNVHYGNFAKRYGGVKGSDDAGGNVAIFKDLQTGIKANTDLLFGSSYANLPISKARNKWVSGNPNVSNYSTKAIVKEMGKDVPLTQLTPKEKDKLFKLFAKWEGDQAYNLIKDIQIFEEGGEYELTDEEINQILKNGGQIEYL